MYIVADVDTDDILLSKKLKSRAKRKMEGQRKFAAKKNEIKEAITLELESLH